MTIFRFLIIGAFFAILAAVAFSDGKTRKIPDGLVAAAGALGMISIPFFPEISLAARIAGFFSVSTVLLAIALIVPGAFGGGDIKLMAVCGFFLGWRMSFQAFFWAILMAGVYVVWLLIVKKAGRRVQFAFGPFLCMGIFGAFFLSGM